MIDIITIRGEHELGLDFTHKVEKDKKKVWSVLKPFENSYLICSNEYLFGIKNI
jgi:hypothetical protein